ncbi:MAG TPA: glycosyl hydrolase [Polyangiaceae bacterium]|jgi:endoglucanase Acf2|nr:glycosyl hydrolase [Polyangiaceae bacterium]
MSAKSALFALIALVGCGASSIDPAALPKHPPGKVMKAGAGFLTKQVPSDEKIAVDADGKRAHPKITKDFVGVPRTNSWWSSLIWQYDPKNPYSSNIYAHPFSAHAYKDGLALAYVEEPTLAKREYMFPFAEDFRVGLVGLASPDTRVASYSDWTVTAEWSGESALRATIGHGLPFVYFRKTGPDNATIRIPQDQASSFDVWHEGAEAIGFSVRGHHYALFAPAKSHWTVKGTTLESDLAGKDYFSVAALPNKNEELFERFRKHAYAFVTGSAVSYQYDEANATLNTHFELTTQLMEDQKGASSDPLIALYPHLWKHSKVETLAEAYVSPRGVMKIAEAKEFSTKLRFNGILPALPPIPGADEGSVPRYVKEIANADNLFPKGFGPRQGDDNRDSYWDGKNLGRNANLLEIAEQLGLKPERDRLLTGLENELTDWFDGQAPREFYYDKEWKSLLAFPSSYGSTDELNDHHFHYGYFIGAAAAVARRDPTWTKNFAPFVDLLVKDVANWERSDTRYPYLRHMDVFAGHSWANGPEHFDEGNNEEASSEDTNCSAAILLWGAATGRKELRDLGIFLLANQISAAEQYWFNVDEDNFPKGFDHHAAGMVWGAGAKYDTWFDRDPALIHGINYLPFTGASLYLGRHPKYVQKAFDEISSESKGSLNMWRDYMMMYLALAAPDKAKKMFDDDPYFEPEFGNTQAMTYDFIAKLAAIGGHVDLRTTADTPLYAVFKNAESRTYLAYNSSAEKLDVKFSDGTEIKVEPHAYGYAKKKIADSADN